MFKFEWLNMLFLLPLPVVLHWLKKRPAPGLSIRFSLFANLSGLQDFLLTNNNLNLRKSLLWLAWGFLLLSISKPIWIDELAELPLKGRDIIISIDLSGSMGTQDFVFNGRRFDRLYGVKKTALDFVDQRKNDRIGLVIFGDQAFLYSPLTFDKNIIKSYLSQTKIGMVGNSTALNDSIIIAIEHFQNNQQAGKQRALILLTDGENHGSKIDIGTAMQIAKEQNIKIYTIGLGTGQGVGETELKDIAEQTNGLYFRAQNINALAKIYAKINYLERNASENLTYKVRKDLFFYPLSIFLLLIIWLILRGK
ncbi:MAG: VWA domain-containing protein [Candidatus Thioglobus sp.]|nr:VWA domain-containing protein [Candidatus Thioglobus sp.]